MRTPGPRSEMDDPTVAELPAVKLHACHVCGHKPVIEQFQGKWFVSCYSGRPPRDRADFRIGPFASREIAVARWNACQNPEPPRSAA